MVGFAPITELIEKIVSHQSFLLDSFDLLDTFRLTMKPLTSKEWRTLLKELRPEELRILRQQLSKTSVSLRDRIFWFSVGVASVCALGLIAYSY